VTAYHWAVLQLGHPANGVERPRSRAVRHLTAPRFNWATPRTGWKGSRNYLNRCRNGSRFNWATPRTGWKARLRKWSSTRVRKLQLGHPANGVERRSLATWTEARRHWLQLGHPANGVERPLGTFDLGYVNRGASIGPPRERGGKGRHSVIEQVQGAGFNWATPRTGWKDSPTRPPGQGPSLQLGHPANGVER